MMIYENIDKYNRETSQYIVAYIDMLGVTSRMQLSKDNQKIPLNKLYNLYRHVLDLCEKESGIKDFEEMKIKIFSDNIIIVKKLDEECEKRMLTIKSVLNCVSLFQCTAASDSVGWLARGGIAIGELFFDEMMVWGDGLLKAYGLENSVAIYPRVAIDSDIIREIKENDELESYVHIDFDNTYFLNYLNVQHFGGRYLKAGFELMKEESMKSKGTYSERVYQKLCWHMNYVNNELEKKKERGEEKYRLNI